jgi:hypothetical protein
LAYTNAVRMDDLPPQAVLRIAVPAFIPRFHRSKTAPVADNATARREEFKRLLDAALNAKDDLLPRYSKLERRQIAMTRKLRAALYGSERV